MHRKILFLQALLFTTVSFGQIGLNKGSLIANKQSGFEQTTRSTYANDVSIQSIILNRFSMTDTDNELRVVFKNEGVDTVHKLEVIWNDGGFDLNTSIVTGLNVAQGEIDTIVHTIPVNYTSVTEKSIAVMITFVNDNPDDDPSNNTLNRSFNTVSQLADKKVVFEEGTGTWCGWCPRGAVAIEHMENLYPDSFIGIAVHNDDPMEVPEYDNNAEFDGFPKTNVDRVLKNQDVSNESFEAYYDARKDLVVPASISANCSIVGSELSIDVSATFNTVFGNADYRLGVILTEDYVHGTTSDYDQANFYSGNAFELEGAGFNWQIAPNPIPASVMNYQHVGRALLGGYDGVPGSVPSIITDGMTVNYSFTYEVPETSNLLHMNAIPVLIDHSTGEIVNANKLELSYLGMEEPAQLAIEVYPNPVRDMATICFEGEGLDYTILITDTKGRIVYKKQLPQLWGNCTEKLDLSGLNSGFFIISVTTMEGTYSDVLLIE